MCNNIVRASQIGIDNRGNRTRKPSPSEPYEDRAAVDRYQDKRYANIDAYFAAVANGSGDAWKLLKVALAEERG